MNSDVGRFIRSTAGNNVGGGDRYHTGPTAYPSLASDGYHPPNNFNGRVNVVFPLRHGGAYDTSLTYWPFVTFSPEPQNVPGVKRHAVISQMKS